MVFSKHMARTLSLLRSLLAWPPALASASASASSFSWQILQLDCHSFKRIKNARMRVALFGLTRPEGQCDGGGFCGCLRLVLVGLELLFWLPNRLMTLSIFESFESWIQAARCVVPISPRRTFARNQATKQFLLSYAKCQQCRHILASWHLAWWVIFTGLVGGATAVDFI